MDNILDNIKSEIGPILKDIDAELFDISLKRTSSGIVIVLLVDTEKGVSIDECALINKRVSGILEEKDIIAGRYIVEVSSPGLDRPLKLQRDFKKVIGERVDMWLLEQVQGKDFVCGVVNQAGGNGVEIEEKNGNRIILPYDAINKAKRSF